MSPEPLTPARDPATSRHQPHGPAPNQEVTGTQTTARLPGFSVALPQFEGPFDLLLSLIARRRLDVTELALAEVTDDFIAYMRSDGDLEHASEFLVVAATLLALKAHRLLPREEDEEDPDLELLEARDLLFARLLQYRAFKEAAGAFRELAEAASRSYPRLVSLDPRLAALMPPLVATVTPEELARAAASALSRPRDPGVQTLHLHERVAVGEQTGLVAERLRRHGRLTFTELTHDADRVAVVVARFLGLLLLHRQGSAELEQTEAMGEITVTWCADQEDLEGIVEADVEEEFS
ncbi:segregation/condensation protein A [Actinomyces sp. 2119]|uniref:segregation and condensation protein A n=1 Tax=Actinomyces sp. 2119 TaxID=2321393 RepID=UPI000E6D3433|nr:ScpA family protein [Actinomyces sp. 2119]RJF44794.1 segregation/condensation protein A [Actinomyces sp. 2119]